MTDHAVVGASSPRAQTLALQGFANRIVRALLRVPLLCRVVGKRLLVVYVVGRKTGRRFVIPVAYLPDGESLLVGTPFGWVHNLRGGEPVSVRYKGKKRVADVVVFTAEADVVSAYSKMARGNRQFAKFNKIGFDAAGNPDPVDLQLAWAAGARALRLTLR
jgi:deazaflavin-dependent oxidoreductase (nitroreductase family)